MLQNYKNVVTQVQKYWGERVLEREWPEATLSRSEIKKGGAGKPSGFPRVRPGASKAKIRP